MKTIPELLDEIESDFKAADSRSGQARLSVLALCAVSDISRLLAALRIALRGYGGDTPELAEIARILAGDER